MNLLEKVRQTKTLVGNKPIYQRAEIGLGQLHPEDASPIALYVLLPGIRWLCDKANEMDRAGVNMFDLRDIHEGDGFRMGPPLIEWSDNTWAIVDGIHRFWLARKENVYIRAIMVRESNQAFPLVGLPVEWREVKSYEVKPEDPKLLKKLRPGIEDTSEVLRSHYRDLSYLGGRGRRPRVGQAN